MDQSESNWSIYDSVDINPVVIQAKGLEVWLTIPGEGPRGPLVKAFSPILKGSIELGDLKQPDLEATDFDLVIMEATLEYALERVRKEKQRRKESGSEAIPF